MDYTNNSDSGFDIAERFHRREEDGSRRPAVCRRAWFADLPEAENYMRNSPLASRDRRIIHCSTGSIVAWRGVINQADPIGAKGLGENALSLADWLSFADMAMG